MQLVESVETHLARVELASTRGALRRDRFFKGTATENDHAIRIIAKRVSAK